MASSPKISVLSPRFDRKEGDLCFCRLPESEQWVEGEIRQVLDEDVFVVYLNKLDDVKRVSGDQLKRRDMVRSRKELQSSQELSPKRRHRRSLSNEGKEMMASLRDMDHSPTISRRNLKASQSMGKFQLPPKLKIEQQEEEEEEDDDDEEEEAGEEDDEEEEEEEPTELVVQGRGGKPLKLSKTDFNAARAASFRNRLGTTMQRKSLFFEDSPVGAEADASQGGEGDKRKPSLKGLGDSQLFSQSLEQLFGDQLQQNAVFPSALFQLFISLCDEKNGWVRKKKKKTFKSSRRAVPKITGEVPMFDKNQIKLETKGPMIRGRVILNCHLDVVVEVLSDTARWKEWDDLVDDVLVLTNKKDYKELHLKMGKRDAVIGRVHKMLSDGVHCFLSKSVIHKKVTKPAKSVNRLDLAASGFLVRPVGLKRCSLFYLNQDCQEHALRTSQFNVLQNVCSMAEKWASSPDRKATVMPPGVRSSQVQFTLEQLIGDGFYADAKRNVLVYLFDRVLSLGCREQGIFRISVLVEEKERVEKALLANDREVLDACDDPHVFAVLLKSIFLSIPPLLPYELMVEKKAPPRRVWASLSSPVQQTVAALFSFIRQLGKPEISKVTLMTEDNLLLVFSPGILRKAQDYAKRNTSAVQAIQEIAWEREALENLYEHFCNKLEKRNI